MKKKLISTLLAFSLLAATLAGCGSKNEPAPANEQRRHPRTRLR